MPPPPPSLACPVCLRPFKTGLRCSCCSLSFKERDGFADLVLSAEDYVERPAPTSQSLFASPLISFVYERGWRQSFAWAGFPGEAAEFETALGYLSSLSPGSALLDLSAGSGLFTRRFAASGRFSTIFSADVSEAMLLEAQSLLRASPLPASASPVTFLRCDAARLPFATASLPAVHAGAALHCWPSPTAALAEISRVLGPGGVFVASTFLDPSAPVGEVLGDKNVLPIARTLGLGRLNSYRWWNAAEIEALCAMVGLTGFRCTRNRQYILFSVTKPLAQD